MGYKNAPEKWQPGHPDHLPSPWLDEHPMYLVLLGLIPMTCPEFGLYWGWVQPPGTVVHIRGVRLVTIAPLVGLDPAHIALGWIGSRSCRVDAPLVPEHPVACVAGSVAMDWRLGFGLRSVKRDMGSSGKI